MSLKILFFPLSIILSLVILIWMVKPEWDSVQKNKVDLAKAQEEYNKVDSQVKMLEKALNDYKGRTQDQTLIWNAIPVDSNKDDVLNQIYQKVKDHELLIDSVTVSVSAQNQCGAAGAGAAQAVVSSAAKSDAGSTNAKSKTGMCLKQESVAVTVIGQYDRLRDCLGSISRMNRYVDIQQVVIKRDNVDPVKIIADFTIQFYSKQKDESLQMANALTTPVGTALLTGKIDGNIIERYKQAITDVPATPLFVEGFGKDILF